MKEARWVCRYLCKIVLHQLLVTETVVPLEAKATHLRPPSLIQQLRVALKLLHGEHDDHHLRVIVLEQLVDVQIVQR
jgi:hypothetical protein